MLITSGMEEGKFPSPGFLSIFKETCSDCCSHFNKNLLRTMNQLTPKTILLPNFHS
ncbi:hypothetical protein BDV38DRAFT_248920 [Aspergillus pseudotamarii]|uniref:Uncharacterized protein n=1 Tax=Aspergillus pseudotamarii TaxID=132259 RepID=A0A5N6SPS0_ASPPS|nr:uncharacterized protein BDV38DRAFT_248920 [Aspergillus pseudotamarii]KAE8136696.1 hypothetical protein BDV38DRAFT_248920 [Aspergillus pseudotamarii]